MSRSIDSPSPGPYRRIAGPGAQPSRAVQQGLTKDAGPCEAPPMSAQADAAHAPTAIDPDVEEVRLALALNGGVSLAVWMGGCAVELDRARRTHYSADGAPAQRGIYQALCDAFRRELVVDVMSGSSAGGI